MSIWYGFVGILERALLWFSTSTGSIGYGIIIFTIIARLLILPLTLTALKSSRKMQMLQPEIKELQRKYGKDPQKLQAETLKLYQTYKINPAASCLPLFLQLPIFFGVYQAVYHLTIPANHQYLSAGVQEALKDPSVAALLTQPFLGLHLGTGAFEANFSGFNGWEYVVLPVLSVTLQLIQQVMAMPRVQDPQQKAISQAMLIMPLFFAYISFTFPSGAVFYWVVGSVIGIIQQYFTTGWGSLANYLKFLPPDRAPQVPTLTPVATSDVAVSAGGEAVATQPKLGFWDVLQPLTEQADSQNDIVSEAEAPESEQSRSTNNNRAAEMRRQRRRR
jgi:YidC/Oxa1 family membrane protein insertase